VQETSQVTFPNVVRTRKAERAMLRKKDRIPRKFTCYFFEISNQTFFTIKFLQ